MMTIRVRQNSMPDGPGQVVFVVGQVKPQAYLSDGASEKNQSFAKTCNFETTLSNLGPKKQECHVLFPRIFNHSTVRKISESSNQSIESCRHTFLPFFSLKTMPGRHV